MIYESNLPEKTLFKPIKEGADSLKIIAGYATPSMVSWFLKECESLQKNKIKVNLIIGMVIKDGITLSAHNGFKDLVMLQNDQFSFNCQYVYQGISVHSKLYLWEKDSTPYEAYIGSANFTQRAFLGANREILCNCDPKVALQYYNLIESDSIYCTHSEVEEYVKILKDADVNYSNSSISVPENLELACVTLSLLTKKGKVGDKSGLNWGQRPGREHNQAYIPVPAPVVRSGFFPTDGRHFSVLTDDKKQLIMRLEQDGCKAMTTPLKNSLLGEYIRNRIGVTNGEYIEYQHLLDYGRTDVKFYQLDEEQYFMDFSV